MAGRLECLDPLVDVGDAVTSTSVTRCVDSESIQRFMLDQRPLAMSDSG
ncbi:hypothetical protein [Rhodococcus sp. BL-253-APC-6A1W]|nr:hypothetical protein [Rhodococcus sp. BL-253-APC-6A1W]